MLAPNAPRILIFDLETLPNIVTSWSLKVHGEYLSHDNILKERTILCASWKWVGEKKVHSISILDAKKRGREADYKILKRLWKLFMQADAVVAHNGDNFDVPWVHTRTIFLGLPPIKPLIQIDTKKIAKARFNFNSNRLDYVAKFLGLKGKIKTDFDLWLSCMEHSDPETRRKAVAEMVKYNRWDVELLEQVYMKLRPFVASKINHALFEPDIDLASRTCPTCGEPSLVKHGFSYTRVGQRQNLKCGNPKCGAWSYKLTGKALPR